MKLRQFLSVLGVVAFLAVIYSPSTLSLTASPGGDGGTAPNDASSSGTSTFLAYLHHSGYRVTVANSSRELLTILQSRLKVAYLLIGADTALSNAELQAVRSDYSGGTLSALVAEGNTTNRALLATFGVDVTGAPIYDPTSTFQDRRVFTVGLSLGSTNATGVIDIASPITLVSSPLQPVGTTSASSFDVLNRTIGPRTVVAAGSRPGSNNGQHVVVLTDSAPFTNFLFNYTQPAGGVNEAAFVAAMLSYVDPGKANPVLLDAAHYNAPKGPTFQAGLPIGPLVAYAVEQSLSGLNGYYASLPSQVSGFLGGLGVRISSGAAGALVALLILFSVYSAVTRWFAPEKRGRDDRPIPTVERTIVAESQARTDFLETSRSKESYVAALSQLYEVLDSILSGEFGNGIASVDEGALAAKIGPYDAVRAKRLFLELTRLREYATGQRRFLFPPVLRWRALAERTTRDAESFLNRLGITIAGEERPGQRVDVLMRERVRA